MPRKRITPAQSRIFLVSAIVIFAISEFIAEVLDLWFKGSPSVNSLIFYNRWGTSLPGAITTGAAVFLGLGVIYLPRGTIVSLIAIGIALIALSFILAYHSNNLFSFTINYYQNYQATFIDGTVANLFSVGNGLIIASIIGYLISGEFIVPAKSDA